MSPDINALCRCGHRNGVHGGREGLGPCDETVRPGELCECEGFREAPAAPAPEARIATAYDAYTNPKETPMPTPTPRTHALQVAQSLDDYLDARGRWKMLATGKLAYVSEATAESVGKARVALVEALEAAIAQPSGNAG